MHFAGGYGTLGEAEQVGAFGVLGTEAALVGREFAVGSMPLSFLLAHELPAGWMAQRETSPVIRPGDADAELASRAARRIRDYLAAHPGIDPVRIRGELAGDDTLVVARAAAVMFAQILALLASGQGARIIPDVAELTTQQAADFLNVSRPY